MTLDPAEAYQRAAALFGETISTLGENEWASTTGSDDWTVVKTVAWVVVGDSHIATAIAGDPIGDLGDFDAAVLGLAPVATWRGTAVAAIEALRTPDALSRSVEHPDGDLVVADLVGQRVSENLVAAWDIGRAVGRPVAIPEDLADWCLDFWAGHAEAILTGGVIGEAPVAPPPSATAAQRLLALRGRRTED